MIPYFDYRPSYLEQKEEIDAAIARVIASGRLVLGPEVESFERELAAYVGAPRAVGVNSGTDALILALRALDVGAGDEVITVANAGVPTVAAIRAAGAAPRFVDVDAGTLLMDPAQLEAARTPRSRCVIPVHLYGRAVPMEPVLAFAARHDLRVVEDCAQAAGTTWRGRHVGSFGDVGCFSFYPTKNLGAFGDAGACVTADAEVEKRLRMLRMYGVREDRHAHAEGVNSRLDEIQAAILRVRLRRLDAAVAERRALAERYRAALGSLGLPLPADPSGGRHAYHLFVVRAPERARVLASLERAGIGYGVHYPEPVHLMEAYRFLGHRPGDLPETERACREVVSLPLYPGLDLGAVDEVAAALGAAP